MAELLTFRRVGPKAAPTCPHCGKAMVRRSPEGSDGPIYCDYTCGVSAQPNSAKSQIRTSDAGPRPVSA